MGDLFSSCAFCHTLCNSLKKRPSANNRQHFTTKSFTSLNILVGKTSCFLNIQGKEAFEQLNFDEFCDKLFKVPMNRRRLLFCTIPLELPDFRVFFDHFTISSPVISPNTPHIHSAVTIPFSLENPRLLCSLGFFFPYAAR